MTYYFVIWRNSIRIRIVFRSKFKVHFSMEHFMSWTAFIIFWMITSAKDAFRRNGLQYLSVRPYLWHLLYCTIFLFFYVVVRSLLCASQFCQCCKWFNYLALLEIYEKQGHWILCSSVFYIADISYFVSVLYKFFL